MTVEDIRHTILNLVDRYAIKHVILFGSRAAGTNNEYSDVDLIMEFSKPISLLTLSMIKNELEEKFRLNVDVIHGPVEPEDMIEIENEVVLYAS